MTDDLPRTLLDIARAGMMTLKLYDKAHDYPRPLERLRPIIPGRVPASHVHRWSSGATPSGPLICRDCGHEETYFDHYITGDK